MLIDSYYSTHILKGLLFISKVKSYYDSMHVQLAGYELYQNLQE